VGFSQQDPVVVIEGEELLARDRVRVKLMHFLVRRLPFMSSAALSLGEPTARFTSHNRLQLLHRYFTRGENINLPNYARAERLGLRVK
jgi:hypothetical protein